MVKLDKAMGVLKCNYPKKNGELCGQTAGWQTDHPGIGYCKFHGGDKVVWQDTSNEKLSSKVQQYIEDPDIFDARKELATLRVTIEEVVEQLDSDRSNMRIVDTLANLIRTLTSAQQRALVVLAAKNFYMTVPQVWQVVNVLGVIVHDELESFATEYPQLRGRITEMEHSMFGRVKTDVEMPQLPEHTAEGA